MRAGAPNDVRASCENGDRETKASAPLGRWRLAKASDESPFARIQGDLDLSMARVRTIRYRSDQPVDVAGTPGGYRLDLALLPRRTSGGVCFSKRWGPHRFEPLGEMFMVPPGESLRARGQFSNQLSIICEFEPSALNRLLDGDLEWSGHSLEGHLDINSAPIKASLMRLHDEIREPGFASETLCELLAMQTAVDLARHCSTIDKAPPGGGLAPWRLRRIDERLADDSTAPSLDELAGLCDLSVRQMTRGYRASRRRSIGDDIVRSRIDHAKRLLTTDAPVKQIAQALGFNAPANFSSAFTRATGESPRQFRARLISCR